MTVSGDFTAEDGGKLVVNIEKLQETVSMNIQFKAGEEVIAGGDYFVPAGVQNYSVLEQYVPEGYKMTVSGDFTAEDGGNLVVSIEKIQKDVIMNIRFVDTNGEFVSGGDYFLPEGVQNYSILEQYVPEGYEMTASGDFFVNEGTTLDVMVKPIQKDIIMNIQFKDADGNVVGGGDFFVPAGVQNYSVLEQYVPEGYEMTVSGDFLASEGGKLVVSVKPETETVIMNIAFKDGDEVIAAGDYFVPAGIQNYSVLQKYVPDGYAMTVSGDFTAEAGAHLDVSIEKVDQDVIMNIQFKDADGNVVGGGDYFVPAGVQNYSVLEQYVPEGYQMTVSGDFMAEDGAHLDVSVEKIQKDIIMNIAFKDGDEMVAGGDYFVPEGVVNYSVLEEYVPEGYRMTVSGDFFAEEGAHLDVSVEKIQKDIIMNIRFMEGDTFVAGGDYTIPEGVNNYSILEEYVPEGYRMTVSGDFMATEGAHLDVNIEKIQKDVIMNIRFMEGDTFIAGGDYFVPEGVNNYSILEQYVPEGYRMTVSGDFFGIEGGQLDVNIEKIQRDIIMNIRFMEGDTFIAGGDYFVPEGVNNYSILEQYVPEGYEMTVSGDFFGIEGGQLDVNIRKIEKITALTVTFETIYGEFVDKTYLETTEQGAEGESHTFKLGEDFQLPEGWQLATGVDQITDIQIPYGSVGGHTMLVEPIPEERGTVLTITFETVDGTKVGETTLAPREEGEQGELHTFKLGADFELPAGYRLAEGVDQITEIQIPYGSIGGHTMIVEKIPEVLSTEPDTEAPSEPATEAPSEPVTEAPSEPATEAPSEPVTEAPSEEEPTEEPTEPTEEPTEEPTDSEEPTEPAPAPGDDGNGSANNDGSTKANTSAPKTGDTTNAVGVAGGLLASLMVLGAALLRKVRR